MFPKFLTVGACFGRKEKLWVNETSFIEKTVPSTWDEEYLHVIVRALGFSYEVKFPSDMEDCGIRLANGTWSGALGMVQRGQVDMAISDFNINDERNEEFRLSFPLSIYESTFITKKPEQVPNPAVFLYPFSVQVWLAILACVCLVLFTLHYLLRKNTTAPKLATSILCLLVGQAMILTPRRPREYLALTTWILGCAFLHRFYAAVLLSFVTFPPMQRIRTIEDLASVIKTGEYESATYPDAIYPETFNHSESPDLRVIGYNLKYYENFDFVEYLEKSGGDKKAVFVGYRAAFHAYKKYYDVSEDNFMSINHVYITRKDFCCGLELDRALHRVWASGTFKNLEANLYYKEFFEHLKYSNNWNKSSSETKLTMTILKGPFLFLIVSHSLAFLVFLIEVCIGKCKRP